MKRDKKIHNAMIKEHNMNFPNEKFGSGGEGTNFEEESLSITSIPVLEDIAYDTTLSSAEIAILRSKDLTTIRRASQL